jgi:hypothetical protein
MTASRKYYALLCTALVLGIALTGCTTGPQPLQPGTPAFYWAAARETYKAGDYLKTNDNLGQIVRSDNEFTARARLWLTIVSSGIAQADMELADVYDLGARANRANPTPFRRQASRLRTAASAAALEFADNFHRFQDAVKEPMVAMDFDFPGGNAAQPLELKKISSGIVLQESEAAMVHRAMIRRGVLRSMCRAVGAPGDAAKGLELFKAGKPQVARDALRLEMAALLHEEAQLFGPTKLDQPARVKMLCGEAIEALDSMAPSKPVKELRSKIQGTLKKSKLT